MTRNFPNWLKAYMQYSSFTEAPDSFHFWCGISAVAGALRAKVSLDMGGFSWTPNFYIILVGAAGKVNKSTCINYAMGLLRQVNGVRFGSNSLTWQYLVQNLGEAAEGVILADGSIKNYSCLTFKSSELGSLLDPRNRDLMDTLTDLWDNNTDWSRGTRGDGEKTLENPWINILAGTTPDWIATNMPRSLIGAGFTSRCLFVYGDEKKRLLPYPKRQAIKEKSLVWEMEKPLVEDLERIAALQGEFELTEGAYEFGEAWYKEHYEKPPIGLSEQEFGGYLARKQTHIHKTAMVMAAAKRNELIITEEDLFEATGAVTLLETTMPLVLSRIFEKEDLAPQKKIIDAVRQHKKVEMTRLFRGFSTQLSWKQFDELITNLVQADHIGKIATAEGVKLFWKGQDKEKDGL